MVRTVEDDPARVSSWLMALRTGCQDAAQRLWDRYFRFMVAIADRRLHRNYGAFDAEDVALCTFDAFCHSIRAGRYDEIDSDLDVIKLLTVMTTRQASDRIKMEGAARRGGRGRRLDQPAVRRVDVELDHLASQADDPSLVMQWADEARQLLDRLNDAELKRLAMLKAEGYSNLAIAEQMGYSKRTIQRMIALIKHIWAADLETRNSDSDVCAVS